MLILFHSFRKAQWLIIHFIHSVFNFHNSLQFIIFKFSNMSTFKKEKAPLKQTRKTRNELTEEQKQ